MGFAKPTCMPSAASFHPEFYTNTLDNTCKLDLYICGNAPPWYYSRDCNISFNEKIKMIINSRHYDVLEIESELYPEFYTDPYKNKCKLELLTYGNPPAYYSKDCNVSFNEKINIIKNSKYYAIFALKCLEGGFTGAYENNYQLDKNKHIVQGINCNDIFNSN